MPARLKQGFTLIEVVIYIGLVAIIGIVLTSFATRMIRSNSNAQFTTEALNNARGAAGAITREIRHARGVYYPTSVFDTHPGQLSLATRENLPAGEKETYVDFYVDDNRLYLKRENEAAQLLTSQNVQVTNLVFTQLNTGVSASAVRVEITVAPDTQVADVATQSSVTLTTTAALRSL